MKKFFLALAGGAAACSVAATLTTVLFGFGEFQVSLLFNGLIIGLVVALLGLIATWVCRRNPAQVGFHSVATMLVLLAIGIGVMAFTAGGFDPAALLALSAYGFATGLAGGLCARLVDNGQSLKTSRPIYVVPLALFSALTVLTVASPARLPAPTEALPRVNESNFQARVLSSDLPVVVDFSAGWCGPCRALAPKLEQLAVKYRGKVKFVTVDVEESPNLKAEYEVDSLPTMIRFVNGKPSGSLFGNLPDAEIEEFVNAP